MRPLVCLLIGWTLTTATGPLAARTVSVRVYSNDFSAGPKGQAAVDPVIDLGDTIQWTWEASGHSTQSAKGQAESWNSGLRNLGAQFEHTFSQVGKFWYYCLPHGFDFGNGTAGGMAGTITVTYPGDANLDFAVDLIDFGILKDFFGVGTTRPQADFTYDGKVDLEDFSVLKDNFGRSTPVPEPSGLVLAGAAGLVGLWRRRGRLERAAGWGRRRPSR